MKCCIRKQLLVLVKMHFLQQYPSEVQQKLSGYFARRDTGSLADQGLQIKEKRLQPNTNWDE